MIIWGAESAWAPWSGKMARAMTDPEFTRSPELPSNLDRSADIGLGSAEFDFAGELLTPRSGAREDDRRSGHRHSHLIGQDRNEVDSVAQVRSAGRLEGYAQRAGRLGPYSGRGRPSRGHLGRRSPGGKRPGWPRSIMGRRPPTINAGTPMNSAIRAIGARHLVPAIRSSAESRAPAWLRPMKNAKSMT